MPNVVLGAASGNPLLKSPSVTVFSDNFNRGDGNLIGQTTPVGGKTWERATSGTGTKSFVISGNTAGGTGDNSLQLAYVDCGAANGTLRVTYVGGGTNTEVILPFRIAAVDPLSNYMYLTVTNGKWTLRKRVGAITTTLGVTPITAAAGQIVEIRLSGSQIRIYVNSVLAATFTETDNQAGPRHGIGSIAASAGAPVVKWDNVSFVIPGT